MTGASKPGTLAYNSWLTMQAGGEKNADTCAYNDLALIRIDPADVGRVNPSVPAFGGPTGVGDLARELAYARVSGGFPNLQLVPGTEEFNGNLLEAIAGA